MHDKYKESTIFTDNGPRPYFNKPAISLCIC